MTHVRNFWFSIDVDGKQERFESGPRAKDGGFIARFYQRSHGAVAYALTVQACALPAQRNEGCTGALALRVFDETGACVHEFTTER